MLYTYIIYVYLLCVWHIVSLVCSSIIWSRCFQSLGIFLYASVIFCVRVLFLSFFSSSSSFVVDFVWLYFLRWFDWCRCWCCRYWYRALKFTCIENHSRYIIQRERKKNKKKNSQSENFNFAHRANTLYTCIYIYIFYLWFSTLYTSDLLCTLQKVHRNNWWNVWLFIYVAMVFMCEFELSLFMYTHQFLLYSWRESELHQMRDLNFNILLFTNDGCRKIFVLQFGFDKFLFDNCNRLQPKMQPTYRIKITWFFSTDENPFSKSLYFFSFCTFWRKKNHPHTTHKKCLVEAVFLAHNHLSRLYKNRCMSLCSVQHSPSTTEHTEKWQQIYIFFCNSRL